MGRRTEPWTLHKYGYVHGDPISFVDPTGLIEGGLRGLVARIGVGLTMAARLSLHAIGGALAVWHIAPFLRVPLGPGNHTVAESHNRIVELSYYMDDFRRIGDLYANGGLAGIEAEYGWTGLTEHPSFPFVPTDAWSALSPAMEKAATKYNHYGFGGIYVKRWWMPPSIATAGDNAPFAPGITINEDTLFEQRDYALEMIVHETLHDFEFGGYGHGHMIVGGRALVGAIDEDESPDPGQRTRFREYIDFLYETRDSNNTRLYDLAIQRARARQSGHTLFLIGIGVAILSNS